MVLDVYINSDQGKWPKRGSLLGTTLIEKENEKISSPQSFPTLDENRLLNQSLTVCRSSLIGRTNSHTASIAMI